MADKTKKRPMIYKGFDCIFLIRQILKNLNFIILSMWIKNNSLYPSDSKIVTRDFIIAEGSSSGFYGFLGKDKNPFKRRLFAPTMYIFKVHRNHPMRVFSASINHINIYPANEHKKRHPRTPPEVYRDKMDYDLFTLVLVPYENPDTGDHWKKIEIKRAFVPEKGRPIRDISLIYLRHGINIHSQNSLKISEVMPSQVINHVFYWLKDNKKITSHDKTFETKLEGRISIPMEKARDLTAKLSDILEKRYSTRLIFEDYRKEIASS